MELKGFDDAMLDSSTGLTHAALTGERKQSVGDAERMLSFLVAKFLREHGYIREANYIDIVAGWHEAADGRGLTELQRCKRNYALLNMILDEWMPWHREIPDLSTIDINWYSKTYSNCIIIFGLELSSICSKCYFLCEVIETHGIV